MGLCLFALLLLLVASVSSSLPRVVNVTSTHELEWLLCHNNHWLMEEDTVLALSNINVYIFNNVSFCIVSTTRSLTLTSSSLSSPAWIICNSSTVQPTTGFVFTDVHSLTLQRLILSGCGTFLRDYLRLEEINGTNSSFYFTRYQSAVLVFLRVKSLLVKDVSITSYYGFAILAMNPLNASLCHLRVFMSKNFLDKNEDGFGSGILLIFTDSIKELNSAPHNVTISNAVMVSNADYVKDMKCLTDLLYSHDTPLPVINAAGLTILYAQAKFEANVLVMESKFEANLGPYSGGMLAFHYWTDLGQTVLNRTHFTRFNEISGTECREYGTSLSLILMKLPKKSSPLLVANASFNDSSVPLLRIGSGSVFIGVFKPVHNSCIWVAFKNVQFIRNSIFTTGSCLYARTYYNDQHQFHSLIILMEGITAFNNSQTNVLSWNARAGMFTLFNAGELRLSGFNDFHDNFGSVFLAINTRLVLNGTMVFARNRGENGPAFKLLDNSHLHLVDGLNATFIDNSALMKGGAIFAFDKTSNQCIFKTRSRKYTNIHMTFINNTAGESGSSIFASNLYNCFTKGKIRTTSKSVLLYNNIFKFHSSSVFNDISTPSSYLSLCDQVTYSKPVYPGQMITFYLFARDNYVHRVQYAVVSFTIGHTVNKGVSFASLPSWKVLPNDVNQALLEDRNCTTIQVTLLKKANVPNPHNSTPVLIMSTLQDFSLFHMKLNLSDCPIGFELDTRQGKCVCSELLRYLIQTSDCSISSPVNKSIATIARGDIEWLGLIKLASGSTVVGASKTCVLYCHHRKNFDVFVVSRETVKTASSAHPNISMGLCENNREGALCSQCLSGYSVVLGPDDCKQCGNWWLLTLAIFVVAGPLWIFLLYALKLTLTTGTLNGIIFCSQILQVFDFSSSEYNYISSFIQFFLLSLGPKYPMCFYNGMTELCKSGIIIIYPVYLISILLGLIVCSRYSVKLSNRISGSSVQVLVTVVHLSFSKLLISVLDIFTSINIYYHDTNSTAGVQYMSVWFRDANVEYGKDGHALLMIITLLIVGPILGVYVAVLLAGRPLMRINKLREYLRPVYEAIHAPYKRNKEFFFAARLFIVVLFYALYVIFRGRNVFLGITIALAILTPYAALEGLCRPFKRMSLNIFNFVLLSITSLVYCTSWYFLKMGDINSVVIILAVINSIITVTTLGVIVLHFLWVTGLLDLLRIKSRRLWPTWSRPQQQIQEDTPHVDLSGSFFEPYDRVREPLLSSQRYS